MRIRAVTLGAFATLLMGMSMTTAVAQQQAPTPIPDSIVQKQSLVPGEIEIIDRYVQAAVGILITSDVSNIVNSRRLLTEPLSRSPSSAFLVNYSGRVASRLQTWFESEEAQDKPVVRLNALIVLSRLPGNPTIDLLIRQLNERNPALRYWAVKGMRVRVEDSDNPPSAEATQRIIQALQAMLTVEPNPDILEQIVGGLVNVGTPNAGDAAMRGIEARIQRHRRERDIPLIAELHGIRQQYIQLTRADVESPNNPRIAQSFRLLSRVAFKYMDFATELLQDPTSRGRTPELVMMTRSCDAALRAASFSLSQDRPSVPVGIEETLALNDWSTLRSITLEWRNVLMQPPFNLTAQDLTVSSAAD